MVVQNSKSNKKELIEERPSNEEIRGSNTANTSNTSISSICDLATSPAEAVF